jgi:hypothetical protein
MRKKSAKTDSLGGLEHDIGLQKLEGLAESDELCGINLSAHW